MKRQLLSFAFCLLLAVPAYGAPLAEGNTVVVPSSTVYNINPYNPASIHGVGESGTLTLRNANKTITLPLSSPLYRLNDAYGDTITCIDGVWGIQREIGVMTLDGSEAWKPVTTTSWQNSNTTLYQLDLEEPIACGAGFATHFDVVTHETQKTRIYDGLSVCPGGNALYLRVMNVKNMNTPETLSAWLSGRKEANVPVQFFYLKETPSFEPFDDETQALLSSTDFSHVVNNDFYATEVKERPISSAFRSETVPEGFDSFCRAVTDVQILDGNNGYFLSSLTPTETGLLVTIQKEDGTTLTGEIDRYEADLLSDKNTSLLCTSDRDGAIVTLQLYLPALRFPTQPVTGGSFATTGFSDSVYQAPGLLVPEQLVISGQNSMLFGQNLLVDSQAATVTATDGEKDLGEDIWDLSALSSDQLSLQRNGQTESTVSVIHADALPDLPENLRVLLLGDSLFGEGYYSQFLAQCFAADDTPVTFLGIGTAGETHHEGRGGWAAYDYCHSQSKYGYTNIFLNDGQFDFSYYMDRQGYDGVDVVVLQLGINDLNLTHDNRPEDVIGHLDTIIESIHRYDETIQIYLNCPLLPFGELETLPDKNKRLHLTEAMLSAYENRQEEGIFLVPVYAFVDPYLDFKLEEPLLDAKNQDASFVVTDTTHPAQSGYEALAQTTYQYLKYGQTFQQ